MEPKSSHIELKESAFTCTTYVVVGEEKRVGQRAREPTIVDGVGVRRKGDLKMVQSSPFSLCISRLTLLASRRAR